MLPEIFGFVVFFQTILQVFGCFLISGANSYAEVRVEGLNISRANYSEAAVSHHRWFVRLFVDWFVRLFSSFVRSFVRVLFVRAFVCSFVRTSEPTNQSTNERTNKRTNDFAKLLHMSSI